MILTNKFTIKYDMERIDKDFDVFLVTKSKDLYKTNILDSAITHFQARSVQYSFGAKALILFDKNTISEEVFKTTVMTEYPDATVVKLDILNTEICQNNFYYQNRLLLQLLVNSIRVPRVEGFSYNNLTGKLFYGNSDWISKDKKTKKPYSMYFLEVSFDAGVYLNLEVKTFSKGKYSRTGRYYILDPENGNFRRKLKTDCISTEELFVEKAFGKKKNTVEYFNFSSFKKFQNCKLGIMEQFLQDVKKYLGPYLVLTAGQRENDACCKEAKKEKENISRTHYASILNELGVNFVDVCKTEKSAQVIQIMREELQKEYGINAEAGELQKEKYNIRLIHREDYYAEHDLLDPHEEPLGGFIVQHLTLEEFKEKDKSYVIKKILMELILKGDVYRKKISIYDWKYLNSNKCWTFVTREKIRTEKGVRFDVIENAAGRKTWDRYQYFTVQIDREGNMKFHTFDDVELASDSFEEKIRYVYDSYADDQKRRQKEVEGLVFSDINNIHVIIRTREKTMPNIEMIWESLRQTEGKDMVSTKIVKEALENFESLFPQDQEFVNRLLESSCLADITITKKELKKLMNMHTKAAKRFNRFLHKEYNIWISNEIKNADFSEEYMLENVTDIKYFEDMDTDGEGVHSLNYYAGLDRKSLIDSVYNASIIRQVQAEETIEFKELLPLMAVEFVRINQFTVLPFPFKYLREYKNALAV